MVTLDPKTGKWLLLVLGISLGLNLFVGGFLIGDELQERGHPSRGDWERQHTDNERRVFGFVDRMAGALPKDDRKEFMRVMETYRGELAAAESRVREARQKVRGVIGADNFDRTALESALAEVGASMQEMQKVLHGALADAVSHLSPEARKDLANWNPRDRDKDRDGDRSREPDKDGGAKP